MILLYIAQGDRRITDGEKLQIRNILEQAFPGKLNEMELRTLIEHGAPEYYDIATFAAHFKEHLPEPVRLTLFAAIASVAEADGKTTKSEKERLATVKAALGL